VVENTSVSWSLGTSTVALAVSDTTFCGAGVAMVVWACADVASTTRAAASVRERGVVMGLPRSDTRLNARWARSGLSQEL
jgi:hypothetical protein